jgi:hypothetical protein
MLTTVWYVASPATTEAVNTSTEPLIIEKDSEFLPARTGRYVVVHLDSMKVELMDGEQTLRTIPIVTQGRPGSYYETIGGEYAMDYKIPKHFSSIGHVYMPYSIHVFGNYFIHGIPYYPDGTKVSSAYSGGCVRLEDIDAKAIYDFVQKGTPIIITRNGKDAFRGIKAEIPTRQQMDMTRLMIATVSLDFLTQDTDIISPDGAVTTRRKLIPNLIVAHDDRVINTLVQAYGEKTYLIYMNQKAKSIGLTSTMFTSTHAPVSTTDDDYLLFMKYIDTYKSYLRTVEGSKPKEVPTPIN